MRLCKGVVLEGAMHMSLISQIVRWYRLVSLRAELRALNDHQLQDIGYSRADIPG